MSELDLSFLKSLIGYHARRASLALIEHDIVPMTARGLRVVSFSVLSLISRNAGVTPRQIGGALGIQLPNLTPLLKGLEVQGYIERFDHPSDGRAWSLRCTDSGLQACGEVEAAVAASERLATPSLSERERETLLRLLAKIHSLER